MFLLLATGNVSRAQDLLLLLNGKEIPCRIERTDSFFVEYQPLSCVKQIEKSTVSEARRDTLVLKNGKVMPVVFQTDSFNRESPYFYYRENREKTRRVSTYRVFNIREQNFTPVTPYDDTLLVQETETVIYQQDTMIRRFVLTEDEMRNWVMGRRSARKNFHSPLSTLGAAATGFAGGVSLNYFFSYAPAVVFTAVNGAIKPKVKHTGPEDQPFVQNELFIDGYRMQAAKIKLKNSLIGGLPAVVAGVLVNYFIVP
jgi:hypothetical protein